jgi:hypothetical protein
MAAKKKVAELPAPRKMALAAGDLQEFRLRHQALVTASHQALLVKEAYEKWLADKGRAYGASGKFHVNIQTGEIIPDV